MNLSVVVTTFDRVDLLRLCLEGLATQDASPEEYEVIIVDNAGQEDCQALVEAYGFRYCYEEKVGHCNSRNRGLKEARASWVLYFDDDTKIPADTIRNFLAYLPKLGPSAAAFGGRFYHWYLEEPAPWLAQEFGEGMNPGRRDTFGVLPANEYLIGCFFAVNVEKTLELGAFDPELGMKGKEIGWADETELQYRMRKNGCQVYYAPELVIEHLVQPWKASFNGRLRYAYSHGKNAWLYENAKEYTSLKFVKDILVITFYIAPLTLLRWVLRHHEWYWQNTLLKIGKKYAFALGRITKRWKVEQL